MRIIISPAKKMNTDVDSLPWQDLPAFLDRTEQLLQLLRSMDYAALQKLWKCNDSIAQLNFERLQTMDLGKRLTPAVLAYEGIQYRYMAPGVFTDGEFAYVQQHLRILSGFYGILRPFDGVVPYRLEMGARLRVGEARDLYAFWGSALADTLAAETDCILNLASEEYSRCIARHLSSDVRMITCVFGELQANGRVIEKGTLCKMARGEMVAYMAERRITDPEKVKSFDRLGYRYCPDRSTDSTFVFLLEKEK